MQHPSAKNGNWIVHEYDTQAFSSRDLPWPMGGVGDPTHRTMQETLMTDPARIVLTIHPPEDQAADLDALAATADLLDDLQRDLAQRYPTTTFSGTSDTRGDLIQIVGEVAQHAYTNKAEYAALMGSLLAAIKLLSSHRRIGKLELQRGDQKLTIENADRAVVEQQIQAFYEQAEEAEEPQTTTIYIPIERDRE